MRLAGFSLPASSALALLAVILLAPAGASAQAVDLRVAKEAGGIRLSWTGGAPGFDAYISADPRRVVSPARILGTTSTSDLFRATPDPDERVLFLKVGCEGAGCEERCYGGADDDGDGLTDCDDDECAGSPDCGVETACANGQDDDGDDLFDCDDPDCRACDDADACTADSCDAGEPSGCRHDAITCDDLDECTIDACDPAAGCVFTAVACDDGDACNGLETCDPTTGDCLPGLPVTCDDSDACNGLETCDAATGDCLPGTPVTCDDGDACTGLETCDAATGDCLPGTPVTCDDGDACNGRETCEAATGDCLPGTPVTCDDGDACNGMETCDAATGDCLPGTPVACDDGDACNGLETCDAATGDCLPGTPVSCDDADACNGLETCDAATGDCLPGTPVTCDDLDACTHDDCDPADGTCSFPPRSCDDLDACTVDGCDPAIGCTTTAVRCDDLDACTDDSCDPATGCAHAPRDCDDGLDCTIDTCDPGAGCLHAVDPGVAPARSAELAGRSLSQFPWFAHVTAFNASAPVELGLDTSRLPDLAGMTCDVYVVAARSDAEWCGDPSLLDVRGGSDTRTFSAAGTQANRFPLISAGQVSAAQPAGFGAGYDVVLDCDRDGMLDPDDWMDGLGAEAGLYVVHDLTQPGPHGTGTFDEIGPLAPWPGPWLGGSGEGDDLRVYYPAELDDPSFVGTFPLVLVSHGHGHSFAWYTFLQERLASYGYIVAAHDVDTFFGIQDASSSTLYWTDKVIADQATEGGGVLNGHIDDSRIGWIGHSRGGEGVVRAYDRLHDEGFTPAQFAIGDVRLVVSMAPTDFLGAAQSHPHGVPYTLVYGAADGDVNGCAASGDVATSFNLLERGIGEKSVTYVHGASHSDFHDCGVGGDAGADGPARPGCETVHLEQGPALLVLMERFVDAGGNVPAKDFLWRHHEDLRATGSPGSLTVDREYHPGDASAPRVLDDFETQPATDLASSGGAVTFSVQGVTEGILDDGDGSFEWAAADEFNGMTRNGSGDDERGVTFSWSGEAFYEMAIPAGLRDLRGHPWLSFRAGQISRAPETAADLADLALVVKLTDGAGRASAIRIDAYDAGLEETYQRAGCPDGSAGAGWQDELEVVRIRLDDFRNEGTGLDLSDVRSVRLEVGPSSGASQGRIALDDVQFER